MFGILAFGLVVGGVSGVLDEDGEHQRLFYGILGFVGLGGLLGMWKQTDAKCRADAGVAILDPAPQCEVVAWGVIATIVLGVGACAVAYSIAREWVGARSRRNSAG